MLFAANIAVEQEVIVVSIIIAFLCFHASDVHQHTSNRSLVAILFLGPDLRNWSTKLAHIQDANLIRILRDWLTYVTDNVKARVHQRV